ncbi:MAG: glycerate kinase [Bacteroidota bacterium]
MRILLAPDSFKDALPALGIAQALANGLHKADDSIDLQLFPLGDGGEGTSEILTYHHQGERCSLQVQDPLGRTIKAHYGWSPERSTAYIEMAEASGLQLLKADERNPLLTSTYGTGQMILDALQKGASHIVLCIGGSATNDMGLGMAAALGYVFLDAEGQPIERPTGGDLSRVHSIESKHLRFDPATLQTTVICDVDNPLYGTRGAAFVYGRQKGGHEAMLQELDDGLQKMADVVQDQMGKNIAEVPGGGAAGGLGAGCLAFMNARLEAGIELVMSLTDFDAALQQTDLVITGEGRIDGQTLNGKLIHGICHRAAEYQVPVVAVCGKLEADPTQLKAIGLQAAYQVSPEGVALPEALANTGTYLEKWAYAWWKDYQPKN